MVVPKKEREVEDDFVAVVVLPLWDSSGDDPWVLKLTFDRLRRSLKKEGMASVARQMIEEVIIYDFRR